MHTLAFGRFLSGVFGRFRPVTTFPTASRARLRRASRDGLRRAPGADRETPGSRSGAAPAVSGSGRRGPPPLAAAASRSEEHTSELQSRRDLVCRLLLEKKKKTE